MATTALAALRALPAAMRIAQTAPPAIKKAAPGAMNIAKQGLQQALPGIAKSLGKNNPGLSKMMSSFNRTMPHLSAMSGGPGAVGKPGGGMKMMMGKPEKNWEKATAENGFREIGRVGNKTSGGFRIMMGKPEKNWEKATAENGFHQVGGSSKPGGVRIMAKIEKNWEHAKNPDKSFKQILGPKADQPHQHEEIEMTTLSSAASKSRQRAYSLDGEGTQRKGGESDGEVSSQLAKRRRSNTL